MKWILGGLFLLVLAYLLDMGLLVYAVYALLAIVVGSRWVTRLWAENLVATRRCDRLTAEVGEMVTIFVAVENRGPLPIAWCLIEDLLPKEALFWKPAWLGVHGKRLDLFRLKPREKRELVYQLKCNRRGYYQLGPLVMETGDFFGLHRRYRVASEPHYLLVMPRRLPLSGYEIASRRPIGEVKMSYRIYEDPTRIAGVRAYQRGDPMNRIHWRITARTGELHSKVYEPSTIVGATLLLDFHHDTNPARHEPARSELAITAAASLANTVYELQQQIGLMTNGRDAADRIREEGWASDARTRVAALASAQMKADSDRLRPVQVPTRKGSEQLVLILETLARLELTDGMSFPQLVLEVSPRLPRDASVIAILQTVTAETAISLSNLARQGFAVTAIINTHDEFDFAAASGPLLSAGIETRHLRDEAALADICRQHLLVR